MRKFILAFTALVGLSGGLAIANNYLMTQGAGTSFGSLLVAGVNYVQMVVCDATTPSQCSAVSAAGAQKVDGSAVTQPVSQATASSLNATVIGTGTFATQSSLTQGGSALSATNGIFTNLLLGNAVLSATNGLFTNVLQGNAVLSLTNPSFASITDGTTKAPVKAASTAAVATDAALVVAVSPNNTIPVKVASGQIASGAVASGAIASGAFASGSIGAGAIAAGAYVSGSVLSGAYASGSLASGAVVDLTNISGTTAAGVPAKAAYLGMNVGGNIVGIVGKAASTAAVATDSSTVTNESPNSQLSTAVGTTADAPCTLPATTTTCSEIAVQKAIANAANSAVPLGSASGGMSIKTLPGLTNTAGGTAIKASAGQVFKVQCYNPDATNSALIELFNTASVTLGTTVPFDFVEIGPGQNAGFTYSLVGEQFTTAIQAAGVKTYNTATAPTTAIDCTVAFN